MDKKFNSLSEIEKHFDYGWDCREYLRNLRWQQDPVSPYTGSKNVKQLGFYDNYLCIDTGKYFSMLTGTIFANSKVKLLHWFQVIWIHWQHPELGSSAIARQVGLNQKTVWSMLKKIKTALENTNPIVK